MPRKNGGDSRPERPPATTPEGRENQLVALAVNLAEEQLRAGTASVAVITHYLKMGSERERLERAKIENETKLLDAKVENIASAARIEELYGKAISAMQRYSPTVSDAEEDLEEL